jgi:signal recognition particle receptor subunit beta
MTLETKIVFTGPMGAGKTTAIAAISDTPPVLTDVMNTDRTVDKATTTVGLDFGSVTLPGGEQVRLFGTPGQQRFEFLWRVLVRNAMGLVVLVDNTRPDPLQELVCYLRAFGVGEDGMACVVGIGRTESCRSPSVESYAEALAAQGWVLPVFGVDVRRRADVLLLVDALLAQLDLGEAPATAVHE